MKRLIILFTIIFFLINVRLVRAQGMMGYQGSPSSNVSSSDVRAQEQEENEGKDLLTQLQNKQITCQNLTNDNFEKIGEYFMGQAIGDTSRHIAMNNMMKSMMGDAGEAQMHIAWGKRGSGCDTNAAYPLGMMGMMSSFGSSGWWTDNGGMKSWNGVGGWYVLFSVVISLLVTSGLVLANIWLWKQIRKK